MSIDIEYLPQFHPIVGKTEARHYIVIGSRTSSGRIKI